MMTLAERRMFAKTIVTSDAFLDLPATSRCLYFTLAMFSDDDGFVNSPKSIMRQTGATSDDLKLLIAKRFILAFESGVIVIKHWKIHNIIQKDRYKETTYLEEKAMLVLDENNAYTEAINVVDTPCIQSVSNLDTNCIQSVSKMETQVSLGKKRGEKSNLGEEERANAHVHAKAETKHLHGVYNNVKLTDKELDSLYTTYGKEDSDEAINYLSEYIKMKGYKAQSHYLALRKWVFDALKEDRIKRAELEAREKRVQPHTDTHSTFDSDEFLNAAANRTYGDNY